MGDENLLVIPEPIPELETSDAQKTDAEFEINGDDPQHETLASEVVVDILPGGAPQCKAAGIPSKANEPEKPNPNSPISPWGEHTSGHDHTSEDPSLLSRSSPAHRGKSAALVGLTNGTQRPRAGRAPRCGELGATGTLLRRGRAWPRGGSYSFDPYVGEVRRRARTPSARETAALAFRFVPATPRREGPAHCHPCR